MNAPKPRSTAEIVAKMKIESVAMMERIKAVRLFDRFILGSQSETRLKKSLAAVGRLDLLTTTLLTPAVHKTHTAKLSKSFLARWEKITAKQQSDWQQIPAALRRGTPAPTDVAIANNCLRFFTLIDSVTVVDAGAALAAAMRMKAQLIQAVEAVKGVHCLGAIEAEVISLPIMRTIRDKDTNAPSEKRKMDVCDVLAAELDGTVYQNETNLFLVHFHGILTAKNQQKFEDLRRTLLSNPRLSKAPRQIEIKKLSEEFNGKAKTVPQNLHHIARYITKGGNDWVGNSIALRYKIGFSRAEDYIDEIIDTQLNWRRCEILRAEHKLDGLEDALSMTVHEIAELAIFIHKLMHSGRNATGYIISAGK